jgi:hypothetical protein
MRYDVWTDSQRFARSRSRGRASAQTFAKSSAKMMEATGDTVYSLQMEDVDNTNGGSRLLTLSQAPNGLVKVSEAGSAAYNDTKKL